MITVHNEENLLRRRLDNLQELSFDGPLEFLVVSDGSTDKTDDIAAEYARRDPRYRLIRTKRLGKSGAQNAALGSLNADIVAMSDADCVYRPDYLLAALKYFADEGVGCVTGQLSLIADGGATATSLGLYWRFECLLRKLESRAGILATASGQCMAIRRAAYTPFEARYGDDCVIALDMALRGYRTVYAEDAVVYGSMPTHPSAELRARVRMTRRNLLGTLSRPAILNPFRFPQYAFALVSHKVLRWATPVFILGLACASVVLIHSGLLYLATFVALAGFVALSAIGWARYRVGAGPLPVASQAYSFLLANIGFALGIVGAVRRVQTTTYK